MRCDAVRLGVSISEHLPGLLNSVAMDSIVQTTKSFSALCVRRNTSDPSAFSLHEETVSTIPLLTSGMSSELGLTLRPVR